MGGVVATVAQVFEDRKMSMGRVFERAFETIRAKPMIVVGLAFALGVLPNLVFTLGFARLGLNASRAAFRAGTISGGEYAIAILVSVSVGIVIGAIAQGTLARVTVLASEGEPVTFADSLLAGLENAVPVIGVSIVSSLGILFGMILLLVPGIILAVIWTVAVPALVTENCSILEALRRSAELTRGARWKVFAIAGLALMFQWLLGEVIRFAGLTQYSLENANLGLGAGALIGSIVLGTTYHTITGTLWPSLYVELRQWKEGGSTEQLAEVFA
jgi:hypothetical protein